MNLDQEPGQTLREFLGPMITAMDDYPFEKLTERYDFVGDINSNWKIFLDAFQEYYHAPILHRSRCRRQSDEPGRGLRGAHFQIDGPHRVGSTAGPRRQLRARVLQPDRAGLRSGLFGPWTTSEIVTDKLPPALNPGSIEPWGSRFVPDLPELRDPVLERGWYLTYHYWPTSHNTHIFEAHAYFTPPRNVRERISPESPG